jgi:hypothetical protein
MMYSDHEKRVKKCLPPSFQPVQRQVSSLLSLLTKMTIDNKNELCRNKKDCRSSKMQLRPSMADNFKEQIPDMSQMSCGHLKKEACCLFEKGTAGAKAAGIGGHRISMSNDEVLEGKWEAVCDICNDYHLMVISLENGGHIVTKPFPKMRTTVAKVRAGLADLFSEET